MAGNTALRLAQCTDEELVEAIHFVDAHDEDLEGSRLISWIEVKHMLLELVEDRREREKEDEA